MKRHSGSLRAVLYLRCSTSQQAASGLGLEAQEAACRALAARKGYEVIAVHTDAAISGRDAIEKRPGLQRVLADAAKREDTVVLVYSLSRLARRQSVLWRLLDDRGEYRLQIESASESFDTTSPTGRAMIGMIGTFAQLEADMCSERTVAALEARRARGHKLGAKPLADEKPDVVRELKKLYATGTFTHATLAERLNELALPTKRGKSWHATTVARTLRQEVRAE